MDALARELPLMTSSNKSRLVRCRLVEALRRELMGPSEAAELIPEYPTTRYIVGRLAPAKQSEDDADAVIEETENVTLGVGTGDDEDGSEDTSPPLIIGLNPSPFGLYFLFDSTVTRLGGLVSWGYYQREKNEKEGNGWRRKPRDAIIDGIRVDHPGVISRIVLSESGPNPSGVTVTGADDPEITLEGIVHDFAG